MLARLDPKCYTHAKLKYMQKYGHNKASPETPPAVHTLMNGGDEQPDTVPPPQGVVRLRPSGQVASSGLAPGALYTKWNHMQRQPSDKQSDHAEKGTGSTSRPRPWHCREVDTHPAESRTPAMDHGASADPGSHAKEVRSYGHRSAAFATAREPACDLAENTNTGRTRGAGT